jgi:hypothetical protein
MGSPKVYIEALDLGTVSNVPATPFQRYYVIHTSADDVVTTQVVLAKPNNFAKCSLQCSVPHR